MWRGIPRSRSLSCPPSYSTSALTHPCLVFSATHQRQGQDSPRTHCIHRHLLRPAFEAFFFPGLDALECVDGSVVTHAQLSVMSHGAAEQESSHYNLLWFRTATLVFLTQQRHTVIRYLWGLKGYSGAWIRMFSVQQDRKHEAAELTGLNCTKEVSSEKLLSGHRRASFTDHLPEEQECTCTGPFPSVCVCVCVCVCVYNYSHWLCP